MATKTKSVEEPEVVTTSADEPIVVDETGETPAKEVPAAKNEPEKEPEPEAEVPAAKKESKAPATDNKEISIDLKELEAKRVITHVNSPNALTKENLVKYVTKTYVASELSKKL